MSETKTMLCVECNHRKAWPDAFPSTIYAICWECKWRNHHAEAHPMSKRERRRRQRAEVARVKRKWRKARIDAPPP